MAYPALPVGALSSGPGTGAVSDAVTVPVTATGTDSVTVSVSGDAVNPPRTGTSYDRVARYFYDADSIRSFTG